MLLFPLDRMRCYGLYITIESILTRHFIFSAQSQVLWMNSTRQHNTFLQLNRRLLYNFKLFSINCFVSAHLRCIWRWYTNHHHHCHRLLGYVWPSHQRVLALRAFITDDDFHVMWVFTMRPHRALVRKLCLLERTIIWWTVALHLLAIYVFFLLAWWVIFCTVCVDDFICVVFCTISIAIYHHLRHGVVSMSVHKVCVYARTKGRLPYVLALRSR